MWVSHLIVLSFGFLVQKGNSFCRQHEPGTRRLKPLSCSDKLYVYLFYFLLFVLFVFFLSWGESPCTPAVITHLFLIESVFNSSVWSVCYPLTLICRAPAVSSVQVVWFEIHHHNTAAHSPIPRSGSFSAPHRTPPPQTNLLKNWSWSINSFLLLRV